MKKYINRKWLNKKGSPSTGTVVAYAGPSPWNPKKETSIFFEVSDCHCSARLHKTTEDNMSDFIYKLRKLAKTANDFADHLSKQK
jgi:hypothetical protein